MHPRHFFIGINNQSLSGFKFTESSGDIVRIFLSKLFDDIKILGTWLLFVFLKLEVGFSSLNDY